MRQILPLVGLFYLAGHLVQIHGLTYLVPVKSVFSQSSDVKYRMVAQLKPREAIQPVAGQLSLIGQDGADMVLVPAGEFLMGSDDGGAKENEKPAHRVYLDAFYIDQYEVTNALYEKFVQATGGRRPGAYDMAGNVWEWVADWYDANYYKNNPPRNPRGPENGRFRVVRGGSWLNDPGVVRVSVRGSFSPDEGFVINFGMRCARTP